MMIYGTKKYDTSILFCECISNPLKIKYVHKDITHKKLKSEKKFKILFCTTISILFL